MHRLYLFVSVRDVPDRLVISDRPAGEVIEEYQDEEFRFDCSVQIADDATSFPCDRVLTYR